MSLENATFIHELNEQNPTVADKVRQGDDHLRLLKRTIKNTWANIRGAVLVTHTALNNIPANTVASLAALFAAREAKGTIKMHDIVNVPTLPSGWSLCDGSVVVGYGTVPDMRGAFIRGWDNTNPGGSFGGSDTPLTNTAGEHTHTNEGTALTEDQMPAHVHALSDNILTEGVSGAGFGGATSGTSGPPLATSSTGGGASHTHSMDSVGGHYHNVELPRHIRVVFIVKTSDFTLP